MKRTIMIGIAMTVAGAIIAIVLGITSYDLPISVTISLSVIIGASTFGLATILIGLLGLQSWADRRQRRRVAQVYAQASDDRRRFLQRLDHELKNPLTAIRAGVANLSESANGSTETLRSVETQTLRLSRLAADLRKLADLETRELERSPVNVAALLRDVVATVDECPETADRRLTLILPQAPWPLPTIYGDGDLLFLAIHNLVENAVKFTTSGATIEVRAYENEQQIVIEVADTGPGVAESEATFVWDELYRAQTTHAVPGTGLGLALVRAVVTRHGGQYGLRSRVGQGSVFTIRLPVG